MSMLELLAQKLMNKDAVEQLSRLSGANRTQAKKVVGNAVPILVQAMSDNAGSRAGAESLMGALKEHGKNQPVSEQISQADMADGGRILGKIFGNNKDEVIKALAKKSGTSKAKTESLLSALAPVLLSLISTETTSNNTSPGGLSSLLSLFTDDDAGDENNSTSSNSGLGDIGTAVLMGALLGGGSNSGTAGNLMNTLLGGSADSSPGSGVGGSLLSSILGGGASSSTGLDGELLEEEEDQQGGMLGSILGSGSGSLLSAVLGGSSSSNNHGNNNENLLTGMAASLLSGAFKGGAGKRR